MRSFIALEFDDELKSRLDFIQRKLKYSSSKGSWINSNNFHMTLKFLGEIDSNHIDDIGRLLDNISGRFNPIRLSFDELGVFRNGGEIRVLWIGTKGEIDILNNLYKELENEMLNLGFKKEKREFKPHITLARNVVFDKKLFEVKELIDKDLNYNFVLDRITLMKSEEIMKKRIYSQIKTYKFEKK
jgi:2'-5' RNA ligase